MFLGIFICALIAEIQCGTLDLASKILSKSNPTEVQQFSALIDKFKMKLTNSSEINRRFENFQNAKKNLKIWESEFKGAKFALNKFSLMSLDEEQKYFGAIPPSVELDPLRSKRSALDDVIETTPPTTYDFRNFGKVTSVKDQGGCGSCWAYTVAATIESQFLLHRNQTLDLSEQNLVNCETGSFGCAGGNIEFALRHVQFNGITSETCMPYLAAKGNCSDSCDNEKYYIGGYRDFGTNESAYPLKLYNYGPATMSFNIHAAFMHYASGILDIPAENCTRNVVGFHAMVIVGYTEDYWIAKNSWGTNWGENGYVRFRRGQNFCFMTRKVTVPFLKDIEPVTPTPSSSCYTTLPPITTPIPTPFPSMKCEQTYGNTPSENLKLKANLRKMLNGKRSQIANGLFQMSNGQMAPSASNMRRLEFSCYLENASKNYSLNCDSVQGENTYSHSIYFYQNETLQQAIDYAPREFFNFLVDNVNGKAVGISGIPYFAYENAFEFGCAFLPSICKSNATSVLTCTIHSKLPSSAPVYTVGSACTSNADCDRPRYGKCDLSTNANSTGLCFPSSMTF